MDIIKTGIGLTKTIKNVGRFREILSVFAKNGFEEFIVSTNLHRKVPGFVLPKGVRGEALDVYQSDNWWRVIGYRLRKSFEELGPSFIKLGQLLATREDIFAAPFIAEMKTLQNKVKPIKFSVAKKIIEESLGKKIGDVFSHIDEKPIGVASIGVVYRATLLNGDNVVVKVRKPGIKELITNDFEILTFIFSQIEKTSEEIKYLGLSRVVSDFGKHLHLELNFQMEALNCDKLKANLEEIDKNKVLKIPKAYLEYTTQQVFVMEFLDGTPFNQVGSLEDLGLEFLDKLDQSIGMFIHTLLADGFFHADLHGGNFFALESGKIGIIDFGLMGTLSKKNRSSLIAILYSLVTQNYENMVFEFLEVAEYESIPDHESLTRDIQEALAPFIGLTVQQTDLTAMVRAIVQTLSKHQLYLPREWFIIFRALMTLDGVGKSIGYDIDIYKTIDEEIREIIGELLSKETLMEDALWIGRDILNSVRIIPRHIRWYLKDAAKNNYSLNMKIQGLEADISKVSSGLYFLGYAFVSSIFVLCGSLFIQDTTLTHYSEVPMLSWIFWGIAFVLITKGLLSSKK